ncbi:MULTISPECIES: 2Fe-2S iron-sulfur cluster-binding protein [Aminobacter]|uniref:Ferredoxin n=2 Tax=Aminobacter TaxID=31988 RepID=A0AAC8YL58_AMIAI|nr:MULTISPECIES: 2Fe-2S iron-sulfur cluster-binding protein [Aminobacter]AMS40104.1 Ferredoxin [Aminobacter aminovorans]MBB3710108.1 2Fe-2S ferredoxin [Aminobacter aminovorans]MBB6465633.1 2Fe-2S ferredoxin [Aminobacter lissarensis]
MKVEVHFRLPDNSVRKVEATCGLSLMEAGKQAGVPGIIGDCGGGAMCATCHVYVDLDWQDRAGEPEATESLMLQLTEEQRDNSRLSCQITVEEELDGLVVEVPKEHI